MRPSSERPVPSRPPTACVWAVYRTLSREVGMAGSLVVGLLAKRWGSARAWCHGAPRKGQARTARIAGRLSLDCQAREETTMDAGFPETVDYVIVGGGSAGC